IPVCVKYPTADGETRECTLATSKAQTIVLAKTRGCPTWVYANASEAGYYRVLYETPLLGSLSESREKLTLPERVGLLGELSALTKGRVPLGEAMALAPKFAQDPSPEVVSKTVAIVGDIDDHLVPDELKSNYRRYLFDLYNKRAEELGWKAKPEDSPAARLLRPRLFEL